MVPLVLALGDMVPAECFQPLVWGTRCHQLVGVRCPAEDLGGKTLLEQNECVVVPPSVDHAMAPTSERVREPHGGRH